MKILCVIDSLGSGGAQRQMCHLAIGLKSIGHTVELFLYHPSQHHFSKPIEDANIPVHTVPRFGKKGFSYRVWWELSVLLTRGFDAVVSFQPTANFYTALAKIACPSTTFLAGERTSSAKGLSKARRLTGWMASILANTVVANSSSNATFLRKMPGLSKKVHTIWNGYRIEKMASIEASKRSGLHHLLVVARVSPEKNGIKLLEALQLFWLRNGWVPKVSWAGRTDPDCLHVKDQMDRFLAEHPKLAAQWSWLGEVVDVQSLYREADAMILPSVFEGLPNAVCEAMIAGCPVVASNVCDHPLLLGEHLERGVLCDPHDAESICTALETVHAQSEAERIAMKLNAYNFAKENLSLGRMTLAYEALLVSRGKLTQA